MKPDPVKFPCRVLSTGFVSVEPDAAFSMPGTPVFLAVGRFERLGMSSPLPLVGANSDYAAGLDKFLPLRVSAFLMPVGRCDRDFCKK